MEPGEPSPPSHAILFTVLPFPFSSLQNSVFSYIILTFSLSPARPVVLSNPVQALGKWKRNLYSPCLEGFLPGPWGVDPQASRDAVRASSSLCGLWVLFSNQGPW